MILIFLNISASCYYLAHKRTLSIIDLSSLSRTAFLDRLIIDNESLVIEALCAKEHFDEMTPEDFFARVSGQGGLSGPKG